MKRILPHALLLHCLCLGIWTALAGSLTAAPVTDRPNILWITTEDMSPSLGCYGDKNAYTPNLDEFAKQSVRYTLAFSTAPVCSPSRACLITGMYATSLGNPQLRCHVVWPEGLKSYANLFRDAGYFTSNNVKTDYNVEDEANIKKISWNRCDNKAHWRQRQPGQPFFSVFNFMETHQSRTSVWPWEQFEKLANQWLSPGERTNPDNVILPGFYPDTKLSRRTVARYYDCIRIMDKEAGALLRQLDEDGLADNTIVFFYADHGMGLPRGKRVLQDSGLQVPLLIRFPKKWQYLAPTKPGEAVNRLVSFVDFAPTVLSLAGLPIPSYMQGIPFLGKQAGAPRKYLYGARDRVDEAFDTSRAIRNERWLYIRNFMPHLPWGQPEGYSDASDFRREFLRMGKEGKLTANTRPYVEVPRPIEELYDTQADPQQLHNLADKPELADRKKELAAELRKWILETRDLGFMPEQQLRQQAGSASPRTWSGWRDHYDLTSILDTAELVGKKDTLPQLAKRLKSDNETVRYWAMVGFHAAGPAAKAYRGQIVDSLEDISVIVRLEAAATLVQIDDEAAHKGLAVLGKALISDDLNTVLYSARTLELLEGKARPARELMAAVLEQSKSWTDKDMALYVNFALSAALKNLSDE